MIEQGYMTKIIAKQMQMIEVEQVRIVLDVKEKVMKLQIQGFLVEKGSEEIN